MVPFLASGAVLAGALTLAAGDFGWLMAREYRRLAVRGQPNQPR
jgi:hypothetical protein